MATRYGKAFSYHGGAQSVSVDGLTELRRAITDLPEAFREVVAESIDTGSAIIESEAHARVPYDEGDLDRSIGRNVRADGLQAAVGSGEAYAPHVELGTVDTPAQPWLYPAFLVGARYVRRQMREWSAAAGRKVRVRTRGKKRARRAK